MDIVIGMEDEIDTAMRVDPAQVSLTKSQMPGARVSNGLESPVDTLLRLGTATLPRPGD